jgi:AcrR family transcriptional regulator
MGTNENQKIKRNTKEDILHAAIDLFSESGVSAVSIRDITRKVSINESSLYNHFKSKDELLDAIIEKFNSELGKASFAEEEIEAQLSDKTPEAFLQQHIIRLRERITPTIQKIWKIIYMEQFRDKRARDTVLEGILGSPAAYYEKAFGMMVEKGLIKPIDPKLISDEYNYALFAFSLERMLLETDNKDVMPAVQKMFAHIKFICEAISL